MLVFWGIGEYLTKNMSWLRARFDAAYLCDNDSAKWGKIFYGLECISPEALREKECEVLITVENHTVYSEIKAQLYRMEIPVKTLYQRAEDLQRQRKKIFLWGTIPECRTLHMLLEENQSEYEVSGYVTCWAEQIGHDSISEQQIISLFKAENMLLKNQIAGIVSIADTFEFDFVTRRNVRPEVLESGGFYICKKGCISAFLQDPKSFDIGQIFIPYGRSYRLTLLQFMVTARCNLNCRFCTHFAGLVDVDETYPYEMFEADIERAAELFEDVDNLDIWGGEALLCKDLEKYLYKSHEVFPRAQIYIGTNGLLIKSMKKELIQAIRDTKAILTISMYPPTENIIDDIVDFLRKKGIPFNRGLDKVRITDFYKWYDLRAQSNIELSFRICDAKYCVTIYKGKISPCYFPIVAPFFNEKYGEAFQVDEDVIDLHSSDLTRESMISQIRTPMAACRYCIPYEKSEPWAQINEDPQIEDWTY